MPMTPGGGVPPCRAPPGGGALTGCGSEGQEPPVGELGASWVGESRVGEPGTTVVGELGESRDTGDSRELGDDSVCEDDDDERAPLLLPVLPLSSSSSEI